jgi:hypothetical protein
MRVQSDDIGRRVRAADCAAQRQLRLLAALRLLDNAAERWRQLRLALVHVRRDGQDDTNRSERPHNAAVARSLTARLTERPVRYTHSISSARAFVLKSHYVFHNALLVCSVLNDLNALTSLTLLRSSMNNL